MTARKVTVPVGHPDRRAFSIQEFSDIWGWGRNTTYNLIAAGVLKTVKVGTRRIITAKQEAEFAAYMEDMSSEEQSK